MKTKDCAFMIEHADDHGNVLQHLACFMNGLDRDDVNGYC